MRRTGVLTILVCLLVTANFALADTIRGIDMDFVTIGHAGNAGDTRPEANPGSCGAVAYNYRIGKHEITNAQWNTFVTAVGAPMGNLIKAYEFDEYYPAGSLANSYNENASWTNTQQPANNVSWYEAAQFCNYLTSGDKSKGVYQFSGSNINPGDFLGVNRDAAISSYGIAYVLPTNDEWYKAAYYKPNGSGYSTYANGLNTISAADNGWNYYTGGSYSTPWNVGSGSQELNGTYDMMGNVWEWSETLLNLGGDPYRFLRGGSYRTYVSDIASNAVSARCPYDEGGTVSGSFGFRIAEIPEPASLLLLALGGLVLRGKKK